MSAHLDGTRPAKISHPGKAASLSGSYGLSVLPEAEPNTMVQCRRDSEPVVTVREQTVSTYARAFKAAARLPCYMGWQRVLLLLSN